MIAPVLAKTELEEKSWQPRRPDLGTEEEALHAEEPEVLPRDLDGRFMGERRVLSERGQRADAAHLQSEAEDAQKPMIPIAYTRKFIAIVAWATFFARVRPDSTRAKPACMNITMKPVIRVRTMLSAVM